jgi:hypothetical protein|tara:strand:+ start:1047 stop:1796 length:750 start_codon:yes stop_codon:yes gene_type:complete
MASIPKKLYNCRYCNRNYSRKTSYEKHLLCCEILSNPLEHELNDIYDTPPNIIKLYDIIKELAYKQAKQEKEIESLKQFINKTKKKLNIIDWLNENYQKSITFDSFIKTIKVQRKHLEYIFKYDFIDGLMLIFQEILPLSGDLPIRCFDQKPDTFFIVKNDNWIVMTGIEYEEMLDIINRRIIVEFGEWQEENYEKIIKDENFNNIYEEYIIKVLGKKTSKEITYNRIKKKLYGYLKFNLKRIIHFDFN